jgi:hypothetical protein
MDREEIKSNLKNTKTWLRVVFMVLFALFYGVAISVYWAIVIFQVIYSLITSNINERVLQFSSSLTQYLYSVLNYMTFQTEETPFPFNEWPGGEKKHSDIVREEG